jgi:hypothetical protein
MAKKGTKRDGSKSEAVRKYFKANPGVGAKAAHAELEKAGTVVSLALVNKVKYEGNTKKKTTKRKAASKRKAGGGNMSDQIRAYIAKHPKATRPEIRDGLATQGVTVKTSLVNAVYTKVKKGGGGKAKPGRRGRKPAATKTAATLTAAELIAAKQMIDSMGGANRVREALNLLDQLQ